MQYNYRFCHILDRLCPGQSEGVKNRVTEFSEQGKELETIQRGSNA